MTRRLREDKKKAEADHPPGQTMNMNSEELDKQCTRKMDIERIGTEAYSGVNENQWHIKNPFH